MQKNTSVEIGVCASKRKDFAEKILELFQIRGYFKFVNGGDIGIQKWQQIESLLGEGIISKNSVMIGDRAVDLVAAHKNGISSAGVLWGYGSRRELSTEKPRHIFSTPQQLEALVAKHGHGHGVKKAALRLTFLPRVWQTLAKLMENHG